MAHHILPNDWPCLLAIRTTGFAPIKTKYNMLPNLYQFIFKMLWNIFVKIRHKLYISCSTPALLPDSSAWLRDGSSIQDIYQGSQQSSHGVDSTLSGISGQFVVVVVVVVVLVLEETR
jgi:hypothetical protein